MLEADAERAFDAFAAEVERPLFQTAWFLTGDWHLAEDLVQECLARIYQAWPVAVDHPLAYARKALVRLLLSHRRRRWSTERPSAHLPETPAGAPPDVELRRVLIEALQTLPERDRVVVVLRYLADRSIEDVAHDLGRTPNAVRTQARRGLAKLCEQLGDVYADLRYP